jgi:hypothetical protein
MDLRKWLDQENPDLYRAVKNVRAAVEPILARPVHRHYTDHSIEHSERIIEKLGGLTEGIMKSNAPLSSTEVYILLAVAYLHDIGMQDERSVGADLETIRARHHELTESIILQSVEQSKGAGPLSVALRAGLDHVVALVAKGHRKVDLWDRGYDDFAHGDEIIRPRLLSALLRFADELDVDYRRVHMPNLNLMDVAPESLLHWFKCYYVSGVLIENEYIIVWYQFPNGQGEHYKKLIIPLVHSKIQAKLVELQEIFWKHSVKVTLGEPRVREVSDLQSMTFEVERLAYQECTSWYDQEMGRLIEKKSNIPPPPPYPPIDHVDSEIINA